MAYKPVYGLILSYCIGGKYMKKRMADNTEAKEKLTCSSGAEGAVKKRRRLSKGGLTAIIIAAVLLVAAVAAGSIYYDALKSRPEELFNSINDVKPSPSASEAPAPSKSAAPSPTPTLSDYELLMQEADTSLMKNIVNVMLIGVDYAEERTEDNPDWNGKVAYHADVMIILAINFDENTVDMISVPRDTMIKEMPGVEGMYKLNASLDCGGGFPDGFGKVMEANSWMLGGIPIDYYYAVTMPGCKDLVDAIGGVDYDLEMDFSLAGRSYTAGYQHMDGQAVLDYLRVRKNSGKSRLTGGTGDLNRINRQKDMLVAIFNKLKSQNLLVKLPDILDAFDGQLYTNVNFSQTAALALFGMSLDTDNISVHSMGGSMKSVYNWNFCLTDQKKRVELIKEVYGIEVSQYKDHSRSAVIRDWVPICTPIYLEAGTVILNNVNLAGIPDLTDENGLPVRDEEGWLLLQTCNDLQAQLMGYQAYLDAGDYEGLYELGAAYRKNVQALAKKTGQKLGDWEYHFEKNNEVDVDFR